MKYTQKSLEDSKKSSKLPVIILVSILVLTTIGAGGYGIYKLFLQDQISSFDSQSNQQQITSFEAVDTTGSSIEEIDSSKSEKLIEKITNTEVFVALHIPMETSEVEVIKGNSTFWIYLDLDTPINLQYDGGGDIEVEEIYIFGPNEAGDSILARPTGEDTWNSYGLPIEVEEEIYELIFDKSYQEISANYPFTVEEINVETSINANFCEVGEHMGSDLTAQAPVNDTPMGEVVPQPGENNQVDDEEEMNENQEDQRSEEGESYYRIDCDDDDIESNAKILINPIITGGGFGFNSISKGMSTNESVNSDDITVETSKVKLLGEQFSQQTKRLEVGETIYIESYFINTDDSTPISQIKDKTVILGYEMEYSRNQQEKATQIQSELDQIFLSMQYSR